MTDESTFTALIESDARASPVTMTTRESLNTTQATLKPAVTHGTEAMHLTAEANNHQPDADEALGLRAFYAFVVERYGTPR